MVAAVVFVLFFSYGLVLGKVDNRGLLNPDLLSVNLTLIPGAAAKGAGLFFIFSVLLPSPFFSFFLLIINSSSSNAVVCLDGTPPGYHFHPGFGSGANSWVIHLEVCLWIPKINQLYFLFISFLFLSF